jgi:hypothetical protein
MFSDQQWSLQGSAKCSSSCGSASSWSGNAQVLGTTRCALRPTREGVADGCLAGGQKNLLLRHKPSGLLWCQRCAADALDFRKVEPQMPAVIVLAEHDFTIGACDGVTQQVAIATLLKNRSGDTEIGDTA